MKIDPDYLGHTLLDRSLHGVVIEATDEERKFLSRLDRPYLKRKARKILRSIWMCMHFQAPFDVDVELRRRGLTYSAPFVSSKPTFAIYNMQFRLRGPTAYQYSRTLNKMSDLLKSRKPAKVQCRTHTALVLKLNYTLSRGV